MLCVFVCRPSRPTALVCRTSRSTVSCQRCAVDPPSDSARSVQSVPTAASSPSSAMPTVSSTTSWPSTSARSMRHSTLSPPSLTWCRERAVSSSPPATSGFLASLRLARRSPWSVCSCVPPRDSLSRCCSHGNDPHKSLRVSRAHCSHLFACSSYL